MTEDKMAIMEEVSKAIDLVNDLKDAKRIALEELGDIPINPTEKNALESALIDNKIILILDGIFDANGGGNIYSSLYHLLK